MPPIDLLSLVLTLRPAAPAKSAESLPAWWGRAAHALLLRVVAAADPQLAESLHAENNLRPFTTSTLMGRFPQGGLDPQGSYTLRLTALHAGTAGILLEAAQSGLLAPGSTIELDYLPFQVEAAAWQPQDHPWAAATTYQDLSAPLLLAQQPAPRRLTLQFTSPTTFKSEGLHVPVPLPELVFGSLLSRWNSFAPIVFPPETLRYARECLAISRYRLSSRAAPLKGSGLRVGGVGDVTYVSLNYDRYWMSVTGVLAEYALFAGAGAGTTMGLGQCRAVPIAPGAPQEE